MRAVWYAAAGAGFVTPETSIVLAWLIVLPPAKSTSATKGETAGPPLLIFVALTPPAFRFDWDQVRRALSNRTRLIIINSPQNQSCTVVDAQDLDALAALIRDRPITLLADEVY